jgi:hypothetical protein
VKVTFTKHERRYSVYVRRDRAVDLFSGSAPGYDDRLPHDLLHFVAEAHFGLDEGIFGTLAAGRRAKLFCPVDPKETAKVWRQNRIKKVTLPEGRRSEQLADQLEHGWKARTLDAPLQAKLDELAERWHALPIGDALTLEWPRPEGRKRHTPGRGLPATRGSNGRRRAGSRHARG